MLKTLRWAVPIVLGLLLLAAVAYTSIIAQVLIRVQRVEIGIDPFAFDLPYEDIILNTEDGLTLHGWYIPATETTDVGVIFLHGLSSNRTHFIQEARVMHGAGYASVLYDMRGHGESDGTFSTLGAKESTDVTQAIAYLQAQGVTHIFLIGESVGAVTALNAAPRHDVVQGVVAISAFSSARDLLSDINDRLGLPSLIDDMTLFWLEQFTHAELTTQTPLTALEQTPELPTLIIHGGRDTTVPLAHAQRLQDAASDNTTLWVIPEGGHGVVGWLRAEAYTEDLLAFIQSVLDDSYNFSSSTSIPVTSATPTRQTSH